MQLVPLVVSTIRRELTVYSMSHNYLQVLLDLKGFHEFDSDVAFTKQLLVEECVFCLPGLVSQSLVVVV